MASYTDPEPASGAELISVSQPLITGNFTYLKQCINKDHNFTSTSNPSLSNSDGYHKVTHFVTQGGNPAAIAGVGQLYTLFAGNPLLYYRDGNGTVTQLTGPLGSTILANGYTTLPGGIILQWGTVISFATSGTVNFPIVFPTSIFSVTNTPNFTNGSIPSSSNAGTYGVNTTTLTTTSFDWRLFSPSSSYTGFKWMAIGN